MKALKEYKVGDTIKFKNGQVVEIVGFLKGKEKKAYDNRFYPITIKYGRKFVLSNGMVIHGRNLVNKMERE